MKKAYKLIAVDMDGTLLKSDKTIHEDSVRDIVTEDNDHNGVGAAIRHIME